MSGLYLCLFLTSGEAGLDDAWMDAWMGKWGWASSSSGHGRLDITASFSGLKFSVFPSVQPPLVLRRYLFMHGLLGSAVLLILGLVLTFLMYTGHAI